LSGIIVGVIMIAFGRLDSARLRHFFMCACNWRYDRKAGAANLPPRNSEKARVPFSIPITMGVVAVLLGG